jgi:predicted DNA-binding transcriptional regulator YafY
MNNMNKIDEAIENRNLVTFTYQGYKRKVEPHHYGTLGGIPQLHSYQVEGGSKNGRIPEWRNFKMDKIVDLSIEKTSNFLPRTDYKPDNSNYSEIKKSIHIPSSPRP